MQPSAVTLLTSKLLIRCFGSPNISYCRGETRRHDLADDIRIPTPPNNFLHPGRAPPPQWSLACPASPLPAHRLAGVRGCAPRAPTSLLAAARRGAGMCPACFLSPALSARAAQARSHKRNGSQCIKCAACWVGRGAGICPACSQVDMTAESAGVRGCAPRAHKLCCAALRCAGSQSAMDPNATAFEGECCRTRAACTRTQRSPTSAAQSILACADLSEQPCLSSTGAAEHSCGPTSWQSWSTCSCA